MFIAKDLRCFGEDMLVLNLGEMLAGEFKSYTTAGSRHDKVKQSIIVWQTAV